jgi:hypothetical protein
MARPPLSLVTEDQTPTVPAPESVSPGAKALLGLSVMNGQDLAPAPPAAPKSTGWVQGPNPTYDNFRFTTLPGMEAAPETINGMETRGIVAKPSGAEVWGAAFRLENVVGSMLSREQNPDPLATFDPDFDPLSDENLEGFEDFSDRFIDVRSALQSEALKRQITREMQDRETLMRAGLGGVGAMLVAGTVDPTILIPIGGQVKKGESLLKIGGRFAVAGGAGAALSEGILQGTQETRTLEESGLNIAGGTLLGGLLGTAGAGIYRGATGKPIMRFDEDWEPLSRQIEREMIYDPDGDPILGAQKADDAAMRNPGSLSAAAVRETTLEDFALAPSLGTADVTAALRLNPLLRLSTASSPIAREMGNMLMENGMYLGRNNRGEASPIAVETAMTEYRGWHSTAEMARQEALKAHRKAGGQMPSRQFNEAVGMALRRGDTSDDPHVAQAAKAYRAALDKTKDRAIEMGLLPKDVDVTTAPSYFHRMWNRNVLIRRPDDFKAMAGRWLDETFENMRIRAGNLLSEAAKTGGKLADEDAAFLKQVDELMETERLEGGLQGYRDEVTDRIYSTLMGHDARTLPPNITMAERGPLKERTFSIPDLYDAGGVRVEDFLVNDVQEVMDRYMRVMAADIELTRAFGSVDMKDALAKVGADYDKMVKALPKGDEAGKKRLLKERHERLKDLQGVRDVIRGNFGPPTYDNDFARGAAIVRSWNYATMLGGMTVSALPDVANKVLAHGYLGLARDLLGPLISDLKGVKIAAREAQALGVAVEQTLATRIATMADIGDVYGRGSQFERAVGAMTNHFTKWTGMRLWNDVMKTADYVTASNRAIRAMGRADRAGQEVKAWLANLGIGESDYSRIMTQVRRHGETSRGMKLAHVDRWDDAEARRLWIGAMGKNANIQTVTAGAGDKLLMMNSELGKTLGQFKTFAFAANQRVTIRMAQQARMGHGRVLSALASYISLGMVVYYLKSVGSGREPSDDPVTWVREGIDRSGVVSVFMEGFNTAEKVTGQTFAGESPASRYASRGAFAAMLGPSVGRGEDAANFVRNIFAGELKDRDIHAARKLLPYNNIFWLRTLFDELEMGITEATGAEETALSDRRTSVLE